MPPRRRRRHDPEMRTAAPSRARATETLAGHPARYALQVLAVDLAVAGRQAIDSDQDVDVDVADA